MSKLVSYVRSLRATPLGRYIPGNKVLAGALAGGVTVALSKLGVVDIPTAYVSLGAFALVSYLLPESPVAAAHVVLKAGAVKVQQVTKRSTAVTVGDVALQSFGAAVVDATRQQVDQLKSQQDTAEPVSAVADPPTDTVSGVQAPYVGPSQA